MLSAGARAFVAFNFVVLGLSFIATTGVLFFEFGLEGKTDWTAIATFYSHLFIFFPTFGILALIALYFPACVLVDMYTTYVPKGILRFGIGYVLVLLVSVLVASKIAGPGGMRSIFEVKPEVLRADRGNPEDCVKDSQGCLRAPVLKSLSSVRQQSTLRAGMSQFVRECAPDPLMEPHPNLSRKIYCFVTLTKVDAKSCCTAQTRFGEDLNALYEPAEARSLTGNVHRYLLLFKVFFLFVVLAIAGLLVYRHGLLNQYYPHYMRKIQRGVLVGAGAMLVWPLMNLAFLQSSALLYGTGFPSIYRDASPVILVIYMLWALLLVFFFFKSFDGDKDMENMGRISGIVGSAVFALNYQTIIDYAVRFAGAGATELTLGGLFLVGVIALVAVVLQPKRTKRGGVSFDK